ncbi:MAG: T9SS type A sorting domain-containing protein [Bacteroidales bacterium]|nr:T9SS type A sorting domain-containing protein [Bacteroidales bacterium]
MRSLIKKLILVAIPYFLGIANLYSQTLTVSSTNIQVAAASGSTTTFDISSDSYWGVYSIPDWIKLDTVWGNGNHTLVLKVQENPFAFARKADIVVYWLNADWQYFSDIHLSVTQTASAVGLADSVLSIGADAGNSASLSIPFSSYWEIVELPSWLTASNSFGVSATNVTLTATKNPLLAVRSGRFRVRKLTADASYTYATIVVNQTASKTGISTGELTFEAAAGSKLDILVFLGSAFTISELPSWLSTSATSMPGNGVVSFTSSPNNDVFFRVDTFFVSTNTGLKHEVIVKQKPAKAFLSITPSTFNFLENVNTLEVQINSNTNWGLVNFPDWIESNDIFGYTNSTFSLSRKSFEAGRSDTVIAYWFDENKIYNQRVVIVGQGLVLNHKEYSSSFLSISPNPVHDILHIDFSAFNTISKVNILSETGILISSYAGAVSEIDFAALPKATYFLVVYADDEVVTRKIIKK